MLKVLFRTGWHYPRSTLIAIAVAVLGPTLYLKYLTPEKRAARHRLSQADERAEAAINERLRPIYGMFERARKGARPFAAEALSWEGKWAFVKGLAGGNEHREFLNESFARHVLSPDALRAEIEATCNAYASDLDGVEAALLVHLRADLGLDRPQHGASPSGGEAFAAVNRELIDRVTAETRSDAAVAAGREVIALIAAEVAARAAMEAAKAAAAEAGVSGGILGVGAGSAVATLGVGLIVSIIVDYLLDVVFKMAGYDPQAKIEQMVLGSLDKLEAALLREAGLAGYFGNATDGSLRAELRKMHAARAEERDRVVNRMLTGGGK